MKRIRYKLIRILAVMLFTMPTMISCIEDYTYTEEFPNQMFRPFLLQTSVNGNEATLSWKATGTSYVIELSHDSLNFTNELQVIQLDNVDKYSCYCNFKDLWSNSLYSARIKAVSADSNIKDSEYNEITFVTGAENIFYSIKDEDITNNSALLKWNSAKNVSKIVVSAVGVADRSITLSASEISEGQKLIDGLSAGVVYTCKIYLGEMLRGTITVSSAKLVLKTINVNFGGNATTPSLNWNDVFINTENLTGLIDSVGNTTGIDLNVYDAFRAASTSGPSGLDPALGIPDEVSKSGLFGNVLTYNGIIEPTAGFQFKNLDPKLEYTLIILSGHATATDNREGMFTITGASSNVLTVNPSQNKTPILGKFYPASDGTLKIDVTAGPNNNSVAKFYFLNAVKLSYYTLEK
ncbi:MAG: hypothetical protein JXB49_18470 [Bacteroidales bacterium]|nr:hypothetical protein [Bacteroidales bacterium]MBN2820352.1 hypothetical protein [Bacteroidales bacterium]